MAHQPAADCAGCHMPKRRTQDVVHVVMTDHKIQRAPGGPELLAPLAESEPVLTGIRLLETPDQATPRGALGEVYRAAAVVRAIATAEALGHLEKMLAVALPPEPEPWLDLAGGQLKRGRYAAAEATLAAVRERAPGHPLAGESLALALAGQGRSDEAIALLRSAVATGADRAEAEYNLARLLMVRGRTEEAERHLERALAGRPNLVAAWFRLGEARAARGRGDEAFACFRRALELDPTHTGAYLALGEGLIAAGHRAEALRWLRHGARAAAQPEQVTARLAEVEGGGASP